ncbi:Eukaryotic translation initiation factor eIF-1 [Quaeritorhiza haematococci]|nr:Eukaryotic translation initiation factor eIF-1 [Quaeritorhiza haematococci]
MGIPHQHRIKLLAARPELRDPRRLGRPLALEHQHAKNAIPTLMHGKRVVFGEKITEVNEHRIPKAFYPNVVNHFLYSRALDMNILCRLSTYALREIDARGGLDEYMLTISDKYVEDPVAQMYRRKIKEAYEKKKQEIRDEQKTLLGRYGEDYLSLAAYDPFADTGEESDLKVQGYIHIRIQQRNGRKTLTTVQGLPSDLDQKRILKAFKKEFACNGTIVQDEELGEVIQLQGDHRLKIQQFLVQNEIVSKDKVKIHGF